MTLQSTLVQKLETKLKDAENAIQSHLTRGGGGPSSPQSSPRTRHQLEKEYNSKRYQPTPKTKMRGGGSRGGARLRWNDGYVDDDDGLLSSEGSARDHGRAGGGRNRYEDEEEDDEATTRFGDLTFEEREVSDEDEEIPFSRNPSVRSKTSKQRSSHSSKRSMNQRWVLPSSSSSSIQVVSILKDVLMNLMHRETFTATVDSLPSPPLFPPFQASSLLISSLPLSLNSRDGTRILTSGRQN
jgi:hypothetical protein